MDETESLPEKASEVLDPTAETSDAVSSEPSDLKADSCVDKSDVEGKETASELQNHVDLEPSAGDSKSVQSDVSNTKDEDSMLDGIAEETGMSKLKSFNFHKNSCF